MPAILQTERLMLKTRTPDDLEACVEMDTDPQVTEFIPGTWDGSCGHIAFLRERMQSPYPEGMGYWSVFAKENPADFLGWVHLLPIQDDEQAAEIGWRLKRSAWGNGYATEAARSILAHAFGTLGLRRIEAHTHVRNEASKKVIGKLGLRHVADFNYEGKIPSASYRIASDEYPADKE